MSSLVCTGAFTSFGIDGALCLNAIPNADTNFNQSAIEMDYVICVALVEIDKCFIKYSISWTRDLTVNYD